MKSGLCTTIYQKFQGNMKKIIYAICIISALTACNTKKSEEYSGEQNLLTNKATKFFSSEVYQTISSLMRSRDKDGMGQKYIYSLYIKNYGNMSTIFLMQEQYVDSSRSKLADAIEFRGDTALIIYTGLRNVIGGEADNDYNDILKLRGYQTEWDGKTRDIQGSLLYVYNGKVLKVDSFVVASENMIYSDTLSFKFNKKEK